MRGKKKKNTGMILSPCPLCDSRAKYIYRMANVEEYRVKCEGCGFKGPWFVSKEEAWRSWNKRVAKV